MEEYQSLDPLKYSVRKTARDPPLPSSGVLVCLNRTDREQPNNNYAHQDGETPQGGSWCSCSRSSSCASPSLWSGPWRSRKWPAQRQWRPGVSVCLHKTNIVENFFLFKNSQVLCYKKFFQNSTNLFLSRILNKFLIVENYWWWCTMIWAASSSSVIFRVETERSPRWATNNNMNNDDCPLERGCLGRGGGRDVRSKKGRLKRTSDVSRGCSPW